MKQSDTTEYKPCGGCGAKSPDQRCIGCFHIFSEPKKNFYRLYLEYKFEIEAENETEARELAKKEIMEHDDPFEFCELTNREKGFWE